MDGSEKISGWTDAILNAVFAVHSRLGPGLLEHVYSKCLVYELKKAGLEFRSELYLPLMYEKLLIEGVHRLDILVEETVIVEVKAVEKVHPMQHAQLLTYMRLKAKPVGLFSI